MRLAPHRTAHKPLDTFVCTETVLRYPGDQHKRAGSGYFSLACAYCEQAVKHLGEQNLSITE